MENADGKVLCSPTIPVMRTCLEMFRDRCVKKPHHYICLILFYGFLFCLGDGCINGKRF